MHTQATDLKRRREIEAVLRPSGGHVCAHLDRAVGLALNHRWNVTRGEFAAVHATRTIETWPLESDTDFCQFAHEGGHLADPYYHQRPRTTKREPQGRRVSLEGEAYAWLWAMNAAGHRWSRAMQGEMVECLRSYVTFAERMDDVRMLEAVVAHGAARGVVRLHPTPIDPRIKDLCACVDGQP